MSDNSSFLDRFQPGPKPEVDEPAPPAELKPHTPWSQRSDEDKLAHITKHDSNFSTLYPNLVQFVDSYSGPQYMDIDTFVRYAPAFSKELPEGWTKQEMIDLCNEYWNVVDYTRPLIIYTPGEKKGEKIHILTFPRNASMMPSDVDVVKPVAHSKSVSQLTRHGDSVRQAEGRQSYIDHIDMVATSPENIHRVAMLRAEHLAIDAFFKKFVDKNTPKAAGSTSVEVPQAEVLSVEFDDDDHL